MASENTASNAELSDFLALNEFQGESSVSSSQRLSLLFVCKSELTKFFFFAELTEFAGRTHSLLKRSACFLTLTCECSPKRTEA